jgi:hypothetical protein
MTSFNRRVALIAIGVVNKHATTFLTSLLTGLGFTLGVVFVLLAFK